MIGGAALALLIQLVPYGHDQTNPPVAQEPTWDSVRTRELFDRACKDCHSHETVWPWYASIAPVSWMVRWDVDEGRSHFNVSDWGRAKNHGDDAAKMVRNGDMPLWYYLPAHPEAQLTKAESAELIAGLERTFPAESGEEGDGRGEHAH